MREVKIAQVAGLGTRAAGASGAGASGAAGRERRPVPELQALAARGETALGFDADYADVIGWVAKHFETPAVAVACSMADAVLPYVVSQQLPGVDVLFLETGYHFDETVATRHRVADLLDVRVVDVAAARSVAEQDAAEGPELFRRDPARCCALRKVEPLNAALGGYELWFTGVRRDEAPTRANTPLVTWDAKNGLVKVNPLAAWSYERLMEFSEQHVLPANPLLTQGYPSIGCRPCTARVAPGADPRSGRWAGTDKTECGLHT
ncbi:phosphoadenylyl-sulfate reductase [Micrococcales bacterium 31B]|nr:phosphoadenylyl-sulfate reductase [Micrococcales bacterium 31B]